jgi:hypothetical protein
MAMSMRNMKWWLMLLAAFVLTADLAWACEGVRTLGPRANEELQLKYNVTVVDHGTGRVTVVLTIADEGRIKPLDDVELMIPMEEGSGSVDLMVSLVTRQVDGKRVARVHLRKDWAERAQIWLKSSSIDGKKVLERTNYTIPISPYLKTAPAALSAPATEQKKD